ncbi:MAG: S41 family peptidase [Oscillospiraceae bacterium]|nr:S41 family peptidase [Oscillospiraceae bacterium]
MKKSHFWLTAILLALVCSGITFVLMYAHYNGNPANAVQEGAEGQNYDNSHMGINASALKALEVQQMIDTYFIDEYDEKTMTDAIADAMITSTGDRWSYYISADEFSSYMENMSNSYVGIGVVVTFDEEQGLIVDSVTRDSPAYRAGILPGDIITAVEGESTAELGLMESRNRIRGEEGSRVTITVVHEGNSADLYLTRMSIQTEVVKYELLENGVGYIQIVNFDASCAEQTINAIKTLQRQGADRLLFDVRFNPGGLKDELCKLLDYILPEGIIFQSVDYKGREEVIRSDRRCLDIPMAVLINEDSYSAAEFFAAALKEYGVAVVAGSQTVGKGFYQQTYMLSDGSALAISSGRYRTPNGVSLAGVGLKPDIELDLDDDQYYDLYLGKLSHEDDPQFQAALKALLEK